ncbi:hypothetical protein [Streptomyces nojiriensis]|uniref:DUF1775 domain-containing protein n=1 Tax=Streptomyces nojiriensis TaxID=66374 RepID=A0ABQ3SMW8_9ACTN|nr:hypothetical protein [Streptomyces nojiriensis]QTI43051.1 hypothetical protein JYK04_00813 [Streptomyces nojiriensis]GGS30623.1 hypothetical protein GCM10010205_70940 [Streptomyces nojiriensis]GHI69485.1 hypothetical protein Snoj_34030 [Streptomyces nojiriensis]
MRIRIVFSAALAALGLMFLLPAAAHAHGDTVKVVVTGQREGHVTADVSWENDGDAVDEAVAATVNAASVDGSRTVGPWRLVRDPAAKPAGWTTAEALPPGSWKVSVDVGFPALGHGELEVSVPVVDPAPGGPAPVASVAAPVPSSAAPVSSAASAAPAPAASPAQAAEPAAGTEGYAVWWTTAGVAVTAVAGAAVGLLLRRRRRVRLDRLN